MSRALRIVRSGLWGLLVLCVALRIMAWLVAPVMPLLIILMLLVGILHLMMFGRGE